MNLDEQKSGQKDEKKASANGSGGGRDPVPAAASASASAPAPVSKPKPKAVRIVADKKAKDKEMPLAFRFHRTTRVKLTPAGHRFCFDGPYETHTTNDFIMQTTDEEQVDMLLSVLSVLDTCEAAVPYAFVATQLRGRWHDADLDEDDRRTAGDALASLPFCVVCLHSMGLIEWAK